MDGEKMKYGFVDRSIMIRIQIKSKVDKMIKEMMVKK